MSKKQSIDSKFMGKEPDVIASLTDYVQALNWYNYFYDVSSAKPWLVQYCKDNKLSLKNTREITVTMCSIARMANRGLSIPPASRNYLHAKINDRDTDRPSRAVHTVHHRNVPFLGDVEDILDNFYRGEYAWFEPNVYNLLTELKAKPSEAKAIAVYYQPLLADLKEPGYEHLSRKQLQTYEKFVTAIITDATLYSSNIRKPRKPRKRKAANPVQQTAKLTYLPRSDELRILSINPQKIVGATLVYLFNTKYRKLIRLIAEEGKTFAVKGTTIQNVDLEKSSAKVIPKPKLFFEKFMDGTKTFKKRAYDEVKRVPSSTTGRVNALTLILQAY